MQNPTPGFLHRSWVSELSLQKSHAEGGEIVKNGCAIRISKNLGRLAAPAWIGVKIPSSINFNISCWQERKIDYKRLCNPG